VAQFGYYFSIRPLLIPLPLPRHPSEQLYEMMDKKIRMFVEEVDEVAEDSDGTDRAAARILVQGSAHALKTPRHDPSRLPAAASLVAQ
jgi:hypothetical protein